VGLVPRPNPPVVNFCKEEESEQGKSLEAMAFHSKEDDCHHKRPEGGNRHVRASCSTDELVERPLFVAGLILSTYSQSKAEDALHS
jgi:hypothetical protein